MVSHQQAQLRDPTTFNNHSLYHLLSSATATMAKCFTTYTPSNVLALFSLTVCVMLTTSAPTVDVRRSTNDSQSTNNSSCCEHIDRRDIFDNRTTLVSSNICSVNGILSALLVHSVNNMKRRVRIVLCVLGLVFINISHLQLQEINKIINDSNVSATLQLCKIVDSYYQVKAVDNASNIYNTLKTMANDTLTFWVSFMSPSISYVHLSLGHMYHV